MWRTAPSLWALPVPSPQNQTWPWDPQKTSRSPVKPCQSVWFVGLRSGCRLWAPAWTDPVLQPMKPLKALNFLSLKTIYETLREQSEAPVVAAAAVAVVGSVGVHFSGAVRRAAVCFFHREPWSRDAARQSRISSSVSAERLDRRVVAVSSWGLIDEMRTRPLCRVFTGEHLMVVM